MKRIFFKLDRYFCRRWHLSVLDMDAGRWIVGSDTSNIAYLKAENANGRHILIQPKQLVAPYYLLVDDVDSHLICRQHKYEDGRWKPGRMVVETSKENYQVWIHARRRLSLNEKQYWLKKMKSDPGAHPNDRWGRCPGFRNRKEKYRNSAGYPLSRLIWIDWKNRADIPKISIPQDMAQKKRSNFDSRHDQFLFKKQISRSDYEKGDESATDFAYAIALFRRGYPASVVYQRIFTERRDWRHHSGKSRGVRYLQRTVERAQKIVSCT